MFIGKREPLPRKHYPPVLSSEQQEEIIALYDKGEPAGGNVHNTRKAIYNGFTYYIKLYAPDKGYGYQASKLWNARYSVIQKEFTAAFGEPHPDLYRTSYGELANLTRGPGGVINPIDFGPGL